MRVEAVAQRTVEFLVALVLAIVTLPLAVAGIAASFWVYRASPLFVHERLGRGGERFRFAKIRTLPPSTSRYADKHAIAETALPLSMRILRLTHLDELPQLWFVLTGRMSLVGPRPEMAVLHERIDPTAAAERLSVRPGITGLWQVSVHCDGLICDRIEYDRLYVRHRTPLLDAWILWKTTQKMLLGRRIHLFEVPRRLVASERPVVVPTPSTIIDLTDAARTDETPVPAAAGRSRFVRPTYATVD